MWKITKSITTKILDSFASKTTAGLINFAREQNNPW